MREFPHCAHHGGASRTSGQTARHGVNLHGFWRIFSFGACYGLPLSGICGCLDRFMNWGARFHCFPYRAVCIQCLSFGNHATVRLICQARCRFVGGHHLGNAPVILLFAVKTSDRCEAQRMGLCRPPLGNSSLGFPGGSGTLSRPSFISYQRPLTSPPWMQALQARVFGLGHLLIYIYILLGKGGKCIMHRGRTGKGFTRECGHRMVSRLSYSSILVSPK